MQDRMVLPGEAILRDSARFEAPDHLGLEAVEPEEFVQLAPNIMDGSPVEMHEENAPGTQDSRDLVKTSVQPDEVFGSSPSPHVGEGADLLSTG